jgi:hypothetical protein
MNNILPGSVAVMVLACSVGCGAGGQSEGAPRHTSPSANVHSGGTVRSTSSDAALPLPAESVTPADFVARVDNPYFPLVPGTRWIYEVSSTDGNERIEVTVEATQRVVRGVTTTVVHDRVTTPEGEVVEDTYDWYAQHKDGSVWYFGEDTKAYDAGDVSTKGSWEAGVHGARAGIVMPATPRPTDAYRQEWAKGDAEDEARVLALDATANVPFGRFTGLVKTADLTALEPDVLEYKYYARGIGSVYEERVAGGDERVRLVEMKKP